MMHCIRCKEAAPDEPSLPRFCVSCGYPTAQISPYLEADEENFIALRDAQDRPLPICPRTGGLLVACTACGRLCRPTENVCPTRDQNGMPCPGQLVEPLAAFPTDEGALDRSRAADWSGAFGVRFGDPKLLTTEPLQALAFRYGLLVGVSDRALLVFERDGANWRLRGTRTPLSSGAPQVVSQLLLDDGRAYLATANRTLIYDLSTQTIDREILERCRLLRRGGPWLARLLENADGQARLAVECIGGDVSASGTYEIPVPAASVTDLVVDESVAVLATRTGGLIRVDLDAGEVTTLSLPQANWLQVALKDGSLVALGQNEENMLLAIITADRGTPDVARLPRDFSAAFAWVGQEIFLVTPEGLAIFDFRQVTERPQIKPMRTAEPRLLALSGSDGAVRLLLRLRTGGTTQQVILLNHATMQETIVGRFSDPRIVIADDRLVVAAQDDKYMLRTYCWE